MSPARKSIDSTKGLDLSVILAIVQLMLEVGLPAALQLLDRWKKAGSPPPTAAEVRALMTGVLPPEDY